MPFGDENLNVVLRGRPAPTVTAGLFEPVAAAMPRPGPGAFLVRVIWLSLDRINVGARIAICGTIGMPSFPLPVGPRPNRQLLIKRARMQGFIILDHYDRYAAIIEQLTGWYRAGKFRWREDVTERLENAPGALVRLLAGRNTGKALARVGADP